MPFPPAPRVIYAINPLDEVVCQLRFPPILKIDTEPPAAFQELIRADYPNYELRSSAKLPLGLPADLAQTIAAELPLSGQKSHVFTSRDGVWALTLTRQSLALTCNKYELWERFKSHLTGPLRALMSTYHPAFFKRIGLRYFDVIRRSKLELTDVPWSELLQPWLSGVLGAADIANDAYGTETVCGIRLADSSGRVQIRFGLATEEDLTSHEQTEVFLIDSDFLLEQETEPLHVLDHLETFNKQAGRLFRWCIKDRLHYALQPAPVSAL